jgi:hypothetical protein
MRNSRTEAGKERGAMYLRKERSEDMKDRTDEG